MGYKSEQFVKKVDENLICSICHEVFQDPVSCKDGHTFCRECITEWLKKNKKCPLDNGYLEENNLVRQFNLKGVIDNLDVYCHPPVAPSRGARSEQTCGWTGKLQDVDKHRKTCPFQQVRCPHENCNKTIQRREMEEHDEECQLKMIKCDRCRKDVIRREIKKHIEDDCPETLIWCPNMCIIAQGILTMVKRVDLNRHLTNCARAIVDCPFKEQGCLVQVERQQVDKHVQGNMATHMMLLAKQCSLLNKQNLSLNDQCLSLTEQCSSLTGQCSSLVKKNSSLTEQCSSLNDQCVSITKENKLLMDELNKVKEHLNDHQLSRYTWKISDYSTLSKQHPNGSYLCSPDFWLCGYKWFLRIYPNGNSRAKGFLSVSLYLSNNQLVPLDGEISVSFRIKVLSQTPGNDVSKQTTDVSSKTKNGFGWTKFMSAADVLSPPYCNSTDGSLTIQCTIQIVRPQ